MSIPVRQPLASITIWMEFEMLKRFSKNIDQWEKMIMDELNVKKVFWATNFKGHNILVEF